MLATVTSYAVTRLGGAPMLCDADTLAPALQVQVWGGAGFASTARCTRRARACP
jgi:hypothetical protein